MICDEIDSAMNGVNANDLLRLLREGKATFFQSGDLHASLMYGIDEPVQVGHMAGKMADDDLLWIVKQARAECKRRGLGDLYINGRKGWKRYLRMKGLLDGV